MESHRSRQSRRRRLTALISTLLTVLIVAGSCSDSDDGDDGGENGSPTPGAQNVRDVAGPLRARLSTGDVPAPEVQPIALVTGEELDEKRVEELFSNLPPWDGGEAEQEDLNLPAESLRPPRTGKTVEEPFPGEVDESPPEVPSGPLEVLRYQPDGEVSIAPSVDITFNQPMVPLETLGQLDAEDVPATIEPAVDGRWQWIGTRTLRFVHESDKIDRLPMATTYSVTVPAGTNSETGGELPEALTFTFTTPPVADLQVSPMHDSLPLDQVFLATFDQRIDPDKILDAMKLTADGQERDIRLATDEELAADEDISNQVEQATDGRWIAFRADDDLDRDAAIEITVGPDAPSAEGPNTDPESKVFRGRTYAPLKVDDTTCDWGDTCRPGSSLMIQFNNPLDPELFDPALVTVEPKIPGGVVTFSPMSGIVVSGPTKADTRYEVTVASELTDLFGQKLGKDTPVTFDVGKAPPELVQPNKYVITLDPFADEPTLPIQVVNHDEIRVRAYAVNPSEDIATFRKRVEDAMYPSGGFQFSVAGWQEVLDETLETGAEPQERSEVPISLAEALPDGKGSLVVLIEPTGALAKLDPDSEDYWRNRPIVVWVQATDVVLDAYSDNDELLVRASDVSDGSAVEGVTVSYLEGSGVTDKDGLVRMKLPSHDDTQSDLWEQPLIGSRGDDSTVTVLSYWSSSASERSVWYVFDDRGTYRPGESLRLKGWVRSRQGTASELESFGADTKVSWALYDQAGAKLSEGKVDGSSLGGFDLEAEIPPGANLGTGRVDLALHHEGGVERHSQEVSIQDFRTPQFEVVTAVETQAPHLIASPVQVSATAAYYAGGGLPDTPVDWTVRTTETQYAPPGWDKFSFGRWHPWWITEPMDDFGYREESVGWEPWAEEEKIETFSARTDASGRHVLKIDVEGDNEGQPVSVVAEATMTDVDRQAWSDRSELLVHPATTYVGVRGVKPFVEPGSPIEIELVAVDVDGEVVEGSPVTVEAGRVEQQYVDGAWEDVTVDKATCEVTSGAEPAKCEFDTDKGGRYLVSAKVVDESGSASVSELSIWVSGGQEPTSRSVELEEVELVPGSDEYSPGDTAEILVNSPFEKATGLLTISREGMISTRVFTVGDNTATVEIPLEDVHMPNVNIQVDLAGSTVRTTFDGTPVPEAPPRPAYASGTLNLKVSTASRVLGVTATPVEREVEPGGKTSIEVEVVDNNDKPVPGAEVALVVVDEAVLALSGYELSDPMSAFYAEEYSGVSTTWGRESLHLVDPEMLREREGTGGPVSTIAGQLPTTDGDDSAYALAPGASEEAASRDTAANGVGGGLDGSVKVRSNFDALALFEPSLVTGADGTVAAEVTLPDSLTRYRVMAVAVSGSTLAGKGESTLTARLPLMVRPSAPRFLAFGDAFEFPVVLQNQTDENISVEVAIEAGNLDLPGTTGRKVAVPANDRVEVRFPAATDAVGTAGYRVVAKGAGMADAAEGELPVYTPATSEAFATYGVVDGSGGPGDSTKDGAISQPFEPPEGVFPQFGGLEVNTSSTALQALTDALLYIERYDYESADAYAGRILTISALRDVLEAFNVSGMPTPAQLEATVARDISDLVRLQMPNGGFLGWKGSTEVWPFTSIQATQALVVAKDRGYPVPSQPLESALEYLVNIENNIPQDYSIEVKRSLRAYALNVLDLAGRRDPAKALKLYNEAGDTLEMDALAWILPVLDDADARAEILREFANRATETAGAATFATDYGDDEYLVLASDHRTDGIVLDSLIRVAPENELLPKVVEGLLAHRQEGRWDNIQENTFILLALHRYFTKYEATTPDFVARIWLGETYAGSHEYRGRTTDRGRSFVPMGDLLREEAGDLVVAKEGAGRLYYRLGLEYAPTDLDLEPLDRGFVVVRTYEAVNDPQDVKLDADGVWHIKAGATVRVRLVMVADSRRTHVVLMDPYAAGTEPLNPELAVTATPLPPDDEPGGPIPFEPDYDMGAVEESFARSAVGDVWFPTMPWHWYERDSLRDHRAEAYTSVLPGGVYEYTYLSRATTPGRFVASPARAEEVYAPETFGRSGTDIVIVE